MKRIIEFDSSLNILRGPIVDWCKSLRNSTVCEIQLLSNSKSSRSAPLSVVVSLQDGSTYRLQRTAKWAKNQIMPNIQDTIEKVSALDTGPASHPLIAIKFKQNHRPSLLALLRVCHGIQKHGLIFKAPHLIMDCSDNFFALALVLNVTHDCLPHESTVNTPESNRYTPMEDLWQVIYSSLQRQGYTFWEHTIAENTKGFARELIYRLARKKLRALLRSGKIQANESSVAASTIAQIEALAENKELMDSTLWDKAWDISWKAVWKQHAPVVNLRKNGGMQSIANITGGVTTISTTVDGCSAGRTAGRTPIILSPAESSNIVLSAVSAGVAREPSSVAPRSLGGVSVKGDGSRVSALKPNAKQYSLAEKTGSNLYRIPAAERYDYTVNWLGNSCLPLDSKTHQGWSTPRESAIESGWAAAWSDAESCGASAARTVSGDNWSGDSTGIKAKSAGTRSRTHTTHPSILGAISASKAVARAAVRASQRLSMALNRDPGQESPITPVSNAFNNVGVGRPVPSRQATFGSTTSMPATSPLKIHDNRLSTPQKTADATETSSTVQGSTPRFDKNTLSPPRSRRASEASNKQKKGSLPEMGLGSISEASSRVDLPTLAQVSSEPFPVTASEHATKGKDPVPNSPASGSSIDRTRNESATKRLRGRVITRWSDPQRYSELERTFVDKTQERNYREKKESSRVLAIQSIHRSALMDAKLKEADPMKLAEEAWGRAESLSGKANFEQRLKVLAQHEWEKLVERSKGKSLVSPLGEQPDNWEGDFKAAWEQAWKESWAAAWTAVWNQSFKEATSRGIEFGIEKVLDHDPKLKKRTYKQLKSSSAYIKLRESLLANESGLGSLEQIHQWMKEIGYLFESLQYSVPTLRDECMEITVFKSSKTKVAPTIMGRSLGTAAEPKPEPIRMSHYDLQGWLADEYILQKVHQDKQVHDLFLRGIAEVWDSVSEIMAV